MLGNDLSYAADKANKFSRNRWIDFNFAGKNVIVMDVKKLIQSVIKLFGYELRSLHNHVNGRDPYADMTKLLKKESPVVFDVGANVGQTVKMIRKKFPKCKVHSFEPGPSTFKALSQNVSQLEGVSLWNFGLGSTHGEERFFENSISLMNSFLPLGETGAGEVINEPKVQVRLIDDFCESQKIEHIDILKTDTQGFDFEVIKGASRMIDNGQIGLIYMEVIFSDMYENLPQFSEIFDFLTTRGYKLVSFYDFFYQNELASWTDALFIHESCLPPASSAS